MSKQRLSVTERRTAIMEHLEDGGIFRVNQSSLARQYGVAPSMIREAGILATLLTRLKMLVGGPWKLIITLSLVGLYEAYKAIKDLKAQAPDWRMDKPLSERGGGEGEGQGRL